MSKIPAKKHLLAFAFYIIAVAVIFAPVVFGAKSLQPSLYQPNGLVSGWPYGYKGRLPVNIFSIDLPTPAYYEWPVNKTVGDIYKRGELPLWNPYQAAGTPLLADYSSRAFFPYQILEDIMPVESWDFFFLGRLVIAGFFTYLFLALCGLTMPPALVGGLFYMFGGTLIWFINLEQFANVAMTIPVVMFFTELFMQKHGKREAAFLGVSYGLVMLAGQPEAALYALYISAGYIAFRGVCIYKRDYSALLKTGLKACTALAIGLCLAAPLIIPFLENVYFSHHMHPPGTGIGTTFVPNWLRSFAILTPTATEMPADPPILPEVLVKVSYNYGQSGYYRVFATNGVWDYLGGYTGVLPLLLSVTALLTAFYLKALKKHGMLIFFFCFGLSIVLKNFGVAPFLWLGYLPFFDQAWSQRWAGPSWVFAFAASGAFALQAIMDAREDIAREAAHTSGKAKKMALAAPIIAVILFSAVIAAVPLPGIIGMALNRSEQFSALLAPYVVPSMVFGHALAFIILATAGAVIMFYMKTGRGIYGLIAIGAVELWWNVPRGYGHEWLYYKLVPLAIGLAGAFLFLLKDKKARYAGGCATCVIFFAAFMLIDSNSPNGFPERFNPFGNEPPYISFLKGREGRFRVMGGYGVLTPNYAGSVGIEDLRYINAIVSKEYRDFRYDSLLAQDVDSAEREGVALWFTGMPQWITLNYDKKAGRRYKVVNRGVEKDILALFQNYSLMGVKYILMPPWIDLNKGSKYDLPLIYDKEVRIYENPFAFPRSFVVDVEPEIAAQMEKMDSAAVDIALDKGLVEMDPSNRRRKGLKEAVIKEYKTNAAVIEADIKNTGLLVLSDAIARGWKAYVNDKPAAIYKVNGIMRGVLVKEGRNRVVFNYMPLSFKAGLVLFAASAVAVILMVVPIRRCKERRTAR